MQPDQTLSRDEVQWLAEAAAYLERPSLLMRLAGAIGRPLEAVVSLVDKVAPDLVASTVTSALSRALALAVYTLPEAAKAEPVVSTPEQLHQLGTSTSFWHNLSVAMTGLPGGFFGIAGLPVELPVTTTVMLRSIASIAREFGEDLGDAEVRLQCLTVFGFGGPPPQGDGLESTYLTTRIGMQEAVAQAAKVAARATTQELLDMIHRGTAPALVNLIAKIAARFNLAVTEKLMAQSIPVIGAVTAATLNVAFLDHFNRVARYHFGIRRLERKYGAEATQAAYRQQVRIAKGS
ncbi:MAG TPA: EcsC family protein [Pirellulales bacterium]